jgi:hypothetical protein
MDSVAMEALKSDDTVTISETDYGWLFDGPSEDTAMIFYPGAKVEEMAYAPLLKDLAGEGIDVCLVKMPMRLAVVNPNAADDIMKQYDYSTWYMAGHSMGGAVAAYYEAEHSEEFEGVVMLAAYPTKSFAKDDKALLLVGSEDKVIRRKKVTEGRKYASDIYEEVEIIGGNHAQFGSYGKQKGDGEASISAEEQRKQTVEEILKLIQQ